MSTPTTERKDWRSIPALAEIINRGSNKPTLTTHSIRHYIRNSNENGLRQHVRRLGRKILVSESGFFEWLNNQREAA